MDMNKDFERYLRTVKRYSDNTVASYAKDIQDFATYAQVTDGCHKTWGTVTEKDIQDYLVYLTNDGKKPATVKRHRSTLATFYNWACRYGLTSHNPAKFCSTPKLDIMQPTIIPREAIDTVIGNGGTAGAITAILYETGIRVQELIDLNFLNIDRGRRTILVKGKGRKQRYVIYGDMTEEYIKDMESNPFEGYGQRKIRAILNDAFEPMGYHCNPHMLRHSFATNLVKNGCPLETVRQLLGHNEISTTGRYLGMPTDATIELYKKYSV